MYTKRIKILSLGNANTGKTALIKRYCEDKFERRYFPTLGVDYGSKKVRITKWNDQKKGTRTTADQNDVSFGGDNAMLEMNVDFFDLSGRGEYFEIRNEFYQGTGGLFLVYDAGDEESFKAIDKWLSEGKRFGLDVCCVPIILCANKADQEMRQVTQKRGIEYAEKHRMTFFETSALDGRNVQSMFEILFQKAFLAS